MSTPNLLGETSVEASAVPPPKLAAVPPAPPRLLCAERRQIRLVPTDLESLLPGDHPARAIWAVVERLDLSVLITPERCVLITPERCGFEAAIRARGEVAGRPAIDPRILVALWLYATSEGIGSARELEELCGAHDAYRWICGGVPACAHTLSDFRVAHSRALDDLLTEVLAILKNQGLVDFKRTAQDGMKVRASAGASSFRRKPSLEKCLEEARQQVEAAQETAEGSQQARAAARLRAAEDRVKRIQRALELLPEVQAKKKPGERDKARVSTTDPDARVMKMGDGGFRPAFNIQLSTDVGARIIAGVDVDNGGNDYGRINPMLDQVSSRTGVLPTEALVDGGYADHGDIVSAAARKVDVYAPVPNARDKNTDPYLPRPDDPPAIAEWRRRMATPEAKEIYKQRASTAETSNANLRCLKGLDRFRVRGISKVTCVVLWAVIAYDILRLISMT